MAVPTSSRKNRMMRSLTPPETVTAVVAFRWVSVEECGEILGLGRNTMTAIIQAGAPVVARKMNPAATQRWLLIHWRKLGKIRSD